MKHYNYKVDKFTGGHLEYVTPCPNNMEGRYTHDLIMVGSKACQRCEHFHHIELENQSVACGFRPKQDPTSDNMFNIQKSTKNEKKNFTYPTYR